MALYRARWFVLTVLMHGLLISMVLAHEREVVRAQVRDDVRQEDRILEILLPPDYDPHSQTGYEVVYVVDAGWHMDLAPYVHGVALGAQQASPAIFVGIPNIEIDGKSQRHRDLLPAQGADQFIEFLASGVIPYIEKTYKTNGRRILYGHSYGGLLSTYALLTRHEVFDAYIALDPPYQGNHRLVLQKAKERLGHFACENKGLWIVGIVGGEELRGFNEMRQLLQTQAPKDLRWEMSFYPRETHQSVCLKGVYDGFRFLHGVAQHHTHRSSAVE